MQEVFMRYLVVVDMQNDFIDGALGTPEAQAIVPKVVKKIEEFDGEVLWTQDSHCGIMAKGMRTC